MSYYFSPQCNGDGNREGYLAKKFVRYMYSWDCRTACGLDSKCRKAEWYSTEIKNYNGICWLWDEQATLCPESSLQKYYPQVGFPEMIRCFGTLSLNVFMHCSFHFFSSIE